MAGKVWSVLGAGTGESLRCRIVTILAIGAALSVAEMRNPNPSWYMVFAITLFFAAMHLYFWDRDRKQARQGSDGIQPPEST